MIFVGISSAIFSDVIRSEMGTDTWDILYILFVYPVA